MSLDKKRKWQTSLDDKQRKQQMSLDDKTRNGQTSYEDKKRKWLTSCLTVRERVQVSVNGSNHPGNEFTHHMS